MKALETVLSNSFVRKILGDTGKTVVLKVLAAAVNYGVIILLAHWLTEKDFGHYATIMSAITFGGVLCSYGANTSIIRFLGEYRAKKKPALAWGAIHTAERTVIVMTLACAALVSIGVLGAGALGAWDKPFVYVLGAFLILPAFTLMDVQNGVLRCYDNIYMALLPKDLGWRPAVIIAGFVASLTLVPEERLLPVVLASGCAITLFAVVQRQFLHHWVGKFETTDKVDTDLPAWKRTSSTIWVTQIARASFGNLDVLVVGALLSTEAAGQYFAVMRTAEVIIFLCAALNLAAGPLVARSYAEGKLHQVRQTLAVTVVAMVGLTGSAFLICIFAGNLVLGIFGEDYVGGHLALIVLTSGQMVSAALGTGVTLTMTGHERVNAKLLLIAAPLTLVGVAILTPIYGIEGTAFASGFGLAVWCFAVWIAVRRLTPFDPSIFYAMTVLWKRWQGAKNTG